MPRKARSNCSLLDARAQCGEGLCAERIDVRFIEPINIYWLSDRALKYGFLFIGLTFGCFALFEALKGLRIHPAQYLLVGLALESSPPKLVAKVEVGGHVNGIAVNPAGTLALAAAHDGTVKVLAIDGKNVRLAEQVKVGDKRLSGIAFTHDGKAAIVAQRDENGAAVLAIDGGKITLTNEKISTGVTPYAVDVSSDGKWAVIGNTGVDSMLGLQGRTFGDADIVTLVDTSQRPFRAVQQISVPSTPEGVAISPDGRWIVVSSVAGSNLTPDNPGRNKLGKLTLYEIRDGSANKVNEVAGGEAAQGVVFSQDGRQVILQMGARGLRDPRRQARRYRRANQGRGWSGVDPFDAALGRRYSRSSSRCSRSARNSARSSSIASRIDIMPSGRSNSTTGMWRNLPSCIIRSARRNGSSGWIVCGCGVITSASLVVAGSRLAASTRKSASRSVKMPISRVPSTTMIEPTVCMRIRRAASTTDAVFGAVIGVCPSTSDRIERIGMAVPRKKTAIGIIRPARQR